MKPLTLKEKVERAIEKRNGTHLKKPKMVRFLYLGEVELKEAFNDGIESPTEKYTDDFNECLHAFKTIHNTPPKVSYMGLRIHFMELHSYFNVK